MLHRKNANCIVKYNLAPLSLSSLTTKQGQSTLIQGAQTLNWCNDEVDLAPNDKNYVSINQKLAGKS